MGVDDEQIIEAIRDVDTPVARAKDVAPQVPIGKRAVLNRLENLYDDGLVEKLDVGARAAVFWVKDRSTEATIEMENGSTIATGGGATAAVSATNASLDDAVPTDDLDVGPLDVDWNALDLPGQGAKHEERVEAVRAAVSYLVDEGVASRADFEEDVYPEYPARYTSGDRPSYSWWNNCIIDGLTQVAEQTELIEKPDYAGDWQYLG